MKLLLKLTIALITVTSNAQIFEPFDSFDGPGEWTSPGGNTGSFGGSLTYNITGDYLDNEFYIFQSPSYDFSTYSEVELLWYQKSVIRPGDVFGLYFYDGGWFYYDLSNLTGYYSVVVPNTTQALAFVLNTIGGTGPVSGMYSNVEFLQIRNDSPLPVEMLDFKASVRDDGNMIEWSTASEFNSMTFDLYRSCDGIDWDLLTELPGAGFSNSEISYSHLDRFMHGGYVYYRIVQSDIDGQQEVYGPVHMYRDIYDTSGRYSLMGTSVDDSHRGLYIDGDGTLKFNQ